MPSPTTTQRVFTVVAAVGVLSGVGVVVVRLLAAGRGADLPAFPIGNLAIGCTWPLAGLALLRGDPRNRCGWLLLATAWISLYQLLGEYSIWNAHVAPLPGHEVTDWVGSWGFALYLLVLPLVPLLFPEGRLPSPRWRWFAWSMVVLVAAATLVRMLVEGSVDIDSSIENPVAVLPEQANVVVLLAAFWCDAVGVSAAVVSVVLRLRRAVGVERTQLQWLALGGLGVAVGLVLAATTVSDAAFAVGLLGVPAAVAFSVWRGRTIDVDLALNRTLVFLVVVAVIGAGGLGVLLRLDPGIAGTREGLLFVAGLAVAMVLAQSVLQRVIDRRWFPQREDAGRLGRRITRAVSESSEPREALAELVDATSATLRLPFVGFVDDEGRALAQVGERPDRVVRLDAVAMGRLVGTLEVAPRRAGEGFAASERRVLDDCAAQAAMLAYAADLVADVATSRRSIVRAREEERRRLRNDLHDGVGPSLAGLALQVDALAAGLDREAPDSADRARAIRDRLRETVADVRAVSHGLRPPVLDQIGLSQALRQLVGGVEPIDGDACVDELDDLPAAAEVAAYAIAAEAVANVVRHSGASVVRLEAGLDDGALNLTVTDNGRGMPAVVQAGVGTTSMRQRAAEVGGRVEHVPVPGGGTAVRLTLPIQEIP